MIGARILAIAVSGFLLSAPWLNASGLSQYREFQLDSGLSGVARQAGMEPAEAKVIHQRPAVIQELSWRAEPTDSVEQIRFSFHDGEVSRMVVDYNRFNTKGLMAEDMVGAIAEVYGAAAKPSAEIALSSIYNNNEPVEVIARWEDSDWSFNLVRSKYKPTFTLVVFSKRLDAAARAAVEEAVRLDRLEAPQKALDLQQSADEERRLQQEKARITNRPDFRP
jgi:hypothetical protein